MPTAVVFVLGGVAAIVLATVITLSGYGRPTPAAAVPGPASARTASPAPPASASANTTPPAEYLLDVSDVADPAQLPRPTTHP